MKNNLKIDLLKFKYKAHVKNVKMNFTFTMESESFCKWHLDPHINESTSLSLRISSNLLTAENSVDPSASAKRIFSPKLANIP